MMNCSTYVRPRPDRRDRVSREQLLNRVRAEFEEMPCLRLTRNQAERLFSLRADICARVLETLVRERSLYCEADDRYRFQSLSERESASAAAERYRSAS